jgi:hypothetical protein
MFNMDVKSLHIEPNDKGIDEVINPEHTKVKAKNEPEVGHEEHHNSNMESGLVPDGKGGAVVDK